MWHLFDKYKGIVWPKSGQMNLIARILNNLCPGTGIKLNTPTNPSPSAPVTICIDTEWLDDYIGDSGDNANITAANGSGLAVNTVTTGQEIDLANRSSSDTFGIKSLKLTDGNTTVVDAKVLATDDYEILVKHIAGGVGINVSLSNDGRTITINNTAPCSCSGSGSGSSSEVDAFVGYNGDLVLASLPTYDSSSHQLKYTPVTLTFDNGRLVSAVAASSPTVITTAVEET